MANDRNKLKDPNDPRIITAFKQLFLFYVVIGVVLSALWMTHGSGVRDFVQFWSISKLAHEGHAALGYDAKNLTEAGRTIMWKKQPVLYYWRYPPYAIFLYWPAAWFPYPVALLLYALITTGLLVAALRRILDIPLVLWATLASPNIAFNAYSGQNGTVSAAFMAIALLHMERRPLLSGLGTAALTYKPHLSLMLLLTEFLQSWKTLAYALLIVLILAGSATLCFGFSAWELWWHALPLSNMEGVAIDRFASIFGILYYAGFGIPLSMTIHLAIALPAALLMIRIWRKHEAPFDLKAAAVPLATLLLPPYIYYYDYALILPSLIFWVRHILRSGARKWEWHFIVLLWALPGWTGVGVSLRMIPLPQAVLLAALWFLNRRTEARDATPLR